MVVLQINTLYKRGSTGKILAGIEHACDLQGIEHYAAFRYGGNMINDNHVFTVSSWLDCHVHNRLAHITGLQGSFSFIKTVLFLRKVSKIRPDIIHLHNIHGSYINHKLLFKYIQKNNIYLIWTLHDCWAFTGGCPHFEKINCYKWKEKCGNCPLAKSNNQLIDTSKYNLYKKRKLFSAVKNAIIVTPSFWLKKLASQTYLNKYQIRVINNGIDLNVFYPRGAIFRENHNLDEKYIILGVAFNWDHSKGLDVFIKLADILSSDYTIIMVGINDSIKESLPDNIISIPRLENQHELAKIYSSADIFLNPTREDTFPTVNIESLACGTPVLTFNTGGSPEVLDDKCGKIVPDDIDDIVATIMNIKEINPFSREYCVNKAKRYDQDLLFTKYAELYNDLV